MNDDLLKESLLELYEAAPCGYLFTAADGTLLRVNQTFLDWTGYTRADLLSGRRLQDLLTVPGKIFYENQFAPLLRMQGFVHEVAFDVLRSGKDPLPVLVNAVRRDHAAGASGGRSASTAGGASGLVACIVFDASSRRAYERELLRARREAEQLAAIVDESDDAILSASADGAIQTWNAGAQRLLGSPRTEATRLRLEAVLPIAARPDEWTPIEGKLKAGVPVQMETVALHASGERIDVSASLTPHLGALNELSGVSAILRDIRERRVNERLQQEFLAMASHELRNPLAAIKGHAQLMQRRQQYNPRSMDTIVLQSNQMEGLVEDLLLASQVAAGRLDLQLKTLDLVAEAHASADAHVRPNAPPIRVEAPGAPVFVLAEQRRLRQVFANLLTNAIKYSPDGGEIVVVVARTPDTASFSIRDQGVGIPPEALPHLFDRFYRVHATAHRARGLGLGLYITQQLAAAHGGRITVASEVGRGSTFTVTLPLAPAPTR